jgi:hypothetical protein
LPDIPAAKLLVGMSREAAKFSGCIHAKFSRIKPPFQSASVDLKVTSRAHAGAIEDSAVNLSSSAVPSDEVGTRESKTSVHMDNGLREKFALNKQGEYVQVGCMKGTRWLFGWGEWGQQKKFAFYDRRVKRNASEKAFEEARIGQVYQFKNCWIYCFNGPIRHRLPQADRVTKIYHCGSSVGGPCLHFIMTMTCDVKEVEAKWIMKQILRFMNQLETLFNDVLSME